MKIYIELFITGMSLGLSSCLYFCAPVTLAYISATQTGWRKGLEASLAFSLGRIIAYLILSLISASLGAYLIRQFYAQRGELLIHAGIGVFIVLLGVLIILGKSPHLSVCWSLKKVKVTSEDSILQQKGGIKEIVLLGLLVGLAPCLPLFEVLTFIALKAQNYLHGVFLGLAFALGTLVSPLILLGPLASAGAGLLCKKPLVYKLLRYFCGLVMIYLGVGTLISAFGFFAP